jgi:flavodoxin
VDIVLIRYKKEMEMKALIVYISISHGSTLKIAQAIQETMQGELATPENFSLNELTGCDCIGFGSGIYKGKHHQSIFEILSSLPNQNGKKAFIFSTSGSGLLLQHAPLRQKLKEKGFVVIGEFACPGINDYGPGGLFVKANIKLRVNRPNDHDVEKAKKYFKQLLQNQ